MQDVINCMRDVNLFKLMRGYECSLANYKGSDQKI